MTCLSFLLYLCITSTPFHYSYLTMRFFVTQLYFFSSSCFRFLELVFKRQRKLSSLSERLSEPISLFVVSCLKATSSKCSMKPFYLHFTWVEMILMGLEVETLISLLVVNMALIAETWPPLEGKYFSLPHTLSDFSLLPEIKLSVILVSCSAVLGSLNSTSS